MSTGAGRSKWVTVYFRDSHGYEPVNGFIDGLPSDHQESIDRKIGRLSAFGPMLPSPHSKQVKGKLRRLKCDYDGRAYRVLYHEAENGFIVLLHAFIKKTPKIPPAEVAQAQSRWSDFKARMGAAQPVPPRAVGHDAP
jgi:phage-related protein